MDVTMSLIESQCSVVKSKKRKLSEEDPEPKETDDSSINQNNNRTLLSLLPSEVILNIFQYLTPLDLMSFINLGDQRLCELTYTIRKANFSSCRRARVEQVTSYFSRIRVKLITELSFNFMVYVRPFTLSQIISRCKNLLSLSLVDCGIDQHFMRNILDNCPKLEKLAWDIKGNNYDHINHASLKTLFIFGYDKGTSLLQLRGFVSRFPNLKYVFMNFVEDDVIVHPLIGIGLSTCTFNHSSSKCDRRYISTRNVWSSHLKNGFCYRGILDGETQNLQLKSLSPDRMFNCPPYLVFRSTEDDMSLLLSDPVKAYSTVILFLTDDFYEVSENLLKCLKEVAGHKLMNLSVELERECSSKWSSNFLTEVSPTIKVCDILEEMFINCRNITVLNISTIHFSVGSPFKAICLLPNLRILSIASCAFFKSFDSKEHGEEWPTDRCQEFKNVVASCPDIQSFYLACCKDDKQKVTEADILPIQDWKGLKHLFLYSITFRSCSFVKKVADHCKELKSFSLIEVAQDHACIFVNDIIYLLKTAKNLSFIRINEVKFNPMHEGFWNAIGKAENLEGICIMTRNKLYVDTKTVITEIKKLKCLSLFHFYHPRACDSLYSQVKKSVQNNSIVNFKIERDCDIPVLKKTEVTESWHHFQPYFSCKYIHPLDVTLQSCR